MSLGVRDPDAPYERYLFRDSEGNYGYVNRSGAIVIPAKYEYARPFEEADGVFACVALRGREDPDDWAVIDMDGKIVKRVRSTHLPLYGELMLLVTRGGDLGPSGFVSLFDDREIPAIYRYADPFSCSLASVARPDPKDGRVSEYAFIDHWGRHRFSGRWQEARSFHEDRAWVMIDRKWRIIDTEGRFVGSVAVDDASDFSEGLAAACAQESWGFVDKDGNWAVPPQFDLVGKFSEGLAVVSKRGTGSFFIDRSGRDAIPSIRAYDINGNFSEGLVYVTRYGPDREPVGTGFVDRKGRLAISLEGCDLAGQFVRGLCPVRMRGRVVYIDRTPKVALTPPPGCKFVHLFPEEG